MQISHTHPNFLWWHRWIKKKWCLSPKGNFLESIHRQASEEDSFGLMPPPPSGLQQGGWEASGPRQGELLLPPAGSETSRTSEGWSAGRSAGESAGCLWGGLWDLAAWVKGCRRRAPICTYSSRTFIFSPFLKDKSSGWMPS